MSATRWRAPLAAALLVLLVTPAEAVSVHDVHVATTCGGSILPSGPPTPGCVSDALVIWALVGPFPTSGPVTVTASLRLDGAQVTPAFTPQQPLPADLGPMIGTGPCGGECPHYTTAGIAWIFSLRMGDQGEVLAGMVTLQLDGITTMAMPFQILEPTPEPTTLLLVGTTLVLIGWRVRRKR